MNPYWGKHFFAFFSTLGERVYHFLLGMLKGASLASDEKQLLVLILASLSLSLIGSFVVLNKMSMMANSLSHTSLLGIVTVYALFFHPLQDMGQMTLWPLFLAALISGFVTISLSFFIQRSGKLAEDASIALVFTFLFALGIILVTLLTRNLHIGIESVMGNIESVGFPDIKILSVVGTIALLFITVFYHPLIAMSFDRSFSQIGGLKPYAFLYALLALCSFAVIASFKAIGVVLALSLLITPTLIAKLFSKKFSKLLALSCLIGIAGSLFSVAFSRHMLSVYEIPLSTSGLLVSFLFIAYFFLYFAKNLFQKN